MVCLLNSFTGNVWIDGTKVDAQGAGLEAGGRITTHDGMAELLLSPGSFLRMGAGSTVLLESADASDVRLRVLKGRALVAVQAPHSVIEIEQSGVTANIRTPGLYLFDVGRGLIEVYSGEASLIKGDGYLDAVGAGSAVKTRQFREIPAPRDHADALLASSELRSANAIPTRQGDAYLYGAPVIHPPAVSQPSLPQHAPFTPTVPLTAPGVPQFPSNKY
jgi:hypothetical protein